MEHHGYFVGLMLFCLPIGWYWSIARLRRVRPAAGGFSPPTG